MTTQPTASRKGINWDQVGPYDARKNKIALGMYALLLLTYVLNAMDRQVFTVVATDVRQYLDVGLPEIGLASTIFTLGMGIAGLPTGWLLARVPRKHVVSIGILIFSVATFMTAHIQGMTDLLLYRFLSGLGEAMQLTTIMAIGTTYFIRHRAIAASALNFSFGIGAIIGPNLGAALASSYGWRSPFLAFGIAGIPAIILVVAIVRSWFSEYSEEKASEETGSSVHLADEGANSLLERGPLLMGLTTIFGSLGIYGYLGLYATYLREALDFETSAAGLAVSFYGLGALLSLIGGWAGDRFDSRFVLLIAMIISAVSGIALFSGFTSLVGHCVLSFIFGAAISGFGYANFSGSIVKSMKRSKAGLASGWFTTTMYIPAAFAGSLLGWLANLIGWSMAGALQLGLFSLLAGLCAVASGVGKKTTAVVA